MAEAPARAGPTLLTTAATSQTIITAGGAGTWTIVRTILIACVNLTAVNVTIGIGTANTDTSAKRILDTVTIARGQSFEWSGYLPLIGSATPDLLYALCDTANGATITCGTVTGP